MSALERPIRESVPLDELSPCPVVEPHPLGLGTIVTCGECGLEVDDEGLWEGRDVHRPKQVGPHCPACGRRRRYSENPRTRSNLLQGTPPPPNPEGEIVSLGDRLPSPRDLLYPAALSRQREPRVMDSLRRLADEKAEDMIRPFEEGLALRPDADDMTERQLLDFYSRQARLAEKVLDRVVGTPVQRTVNANANVTELVGDVSSRAIEETMIALLEGRELPSGE